MAGRKARFLLILQLIGCLSLQAGEPQHTLSREEYLSIVRSYHPIARQASLFVERSRAAVQEARGAFDPVLEAGLDRKTFDGKLYYSYFNPQVTIPTWYGIELKAGAEEVYGERVSPETTLGVTSYAGVKLNANGIVLDRRRATLRQAQLFSKLSEAEQLATVNDLLYDALSAYWNWVRAYLQYNIFSEAIRVNEERLRFVRLEFEQGARPAIDTTEALAQLQQFHIQQNEAWLAYQNAGLELSGFLWLQNDQPLSWDGSVLPATEELQPGGIPSLEELIAVSRTAHPKLQGMGFKLGMLETDRRLKAQYLLPKLGISANWLSGGYRAPEGLSAAFLENNYKLGVDLSIPLFLREARGAYRAAGIKIRETELDRDLQSLQIENKVKMYHNEVVAISRQINIYEQAAQNYRRLLQGERLRFEAGESTLFILNSRENKVLETSQKLIELKTKWHKSYAALLWAAGQLR